MKKSLILSIFLMLIFSSCYSTFTSQYYTMDHNEHFETPEKVMDWVASNIEYKSDYWHPNGDYWQLPDQTYELRRGDCEDYAILFMYFIKEIGYEPELILTKNHAMVLLGNIIYDVNGNNIIENNLVEIEYTYTYNETIYIAYHFHDNTIF